MTRLSILIPVYKAEKYIRRCLGSVFLEMEQFKDVCEVIVVDDGSPDKSGAICDAYAAHWDNLSVIHKENEGTGATRNLLLDKAKGDFVWFVDADDSIAENALSEVLSLIKEYNDVDIIGFQFQYMLEDGSFKKLPYGPSHFGVMSNKAYFQTKELNEYLWNKVFKREFLNDHKLRFDARLMILEDMVFCLKAFTWCNKILIEDKIFYNYFQNNPNSIVQNKSEEASNKKMMDSLFAQEEMLKLCEETDDKEIKNALKKIINFQVSVFLYAIFLTKKPLKTVIHIIKELKSKGLYPIGYTYYRRPNFFITIANIYPLFLFVCWIHNTVLNRK